MASLFTLLPDSAELPDSNLPERQRINLRPVLAFDASVNELCYWTFTALEDLTVPIEVTVYWMMASATTGAVVWRIAVEAIPPGATTNLASSTSFDAENDLSAVTVPSVAGRMATATVTLTNDDDISAGALVRFRLARNAADSGDTAPGDARLLALKVDDAR